MARTRVVSHSELDAYRQCHFKHQLAWREWWLSPTIGPALARGDRFHKVMEVHFKLLQDVQQGRADLTLDRIMHIVLDSELLHTQGIQSEEQELVEWMYRGYCEKYLTDSEWEILEVEMPVDAMLPTHTGAPSSFRMRGKVDLLVRDNSMGGGLWIVDHKTGRDLPKERDLDFDDQFGIYLYLLRRQGLDVRGAIYNAVRTYKLKREMTLDERFLRKPMARLDEELKVMALEAYDLFKEAYKPRPEGQEAPRSPDGERCGWRCPFTEPCLMSRKRGNDRVHRVELMEDMGYVQDTETPRGSRDPKAEGASIGP